MSSPIAGTADDPTIEFTPVIIGGKQFQLFFNLKALAKAQKATGYNFLRGVNFDTLDADGYAALIHAGISHCHPETTVDQVAELIDVRKFGGILKSLVQAFRANGMEPEEENPQSPTPTE